MRRRLFIKHFGPMGLATAGALALAVPCLVPARAAQVPPSPSTVAAARPHVDGGWPRAFAAGGAQFLVYQPQVLSWTDQTHLVALSAVSYLAPDATQPALGTVRIEADTRVSVANRLVHLTSLRLTESSFKTVPSDAIRAMLAELERNLPSEARIVALDRVLAQIDASALAPRNVAGVKADPPGIYVSKTPAVLVNLDGDPIWSPIPGNDLEFAVNTNWDIFRHTPTKTYFLRDEQGWLQAPDVRGPWRPAGRLPLSFGMLPDDENWRAVRAALPGRPASAGLKVLVSTTPAELILLAGEPRYEPVAGTSLLWVSNTESDVFRLGTSGPVYYLVAGRWFSASALTGPWAFASTSLPDDFEKIPRAHPRSRVLASVPGTDEANEAVLLASVPQTARVNRREARPPEMVYHGEPEFESIDGTGLARAVNTDRDVVRVGALYYMCFQGVWFVGNGPSGPWEVATSVPEEIYEIPASSPVHHVTYVEVVEDDDGGDEWVSYACYPGYYGTTIAWGCAVWGTGWYYTPYVWLGAGSPIYWPYMRTYGYSAWYNPWTGVYGTAGRLYGPYGGAAFAARFNPATGTYTRGAAAWGATGARGVAEAYNPRTGTAAATRQGAGVYASWGSTSVQRGDDWVQTAHVTNRRADTTTRVTRTDDGAAASRRGENGFVAKGKDNVYAGKDGSVYRKSGDGSWQTWDDRGWSSVERPDAKPQAETLVMTGDARRVEPPRNDAPRGDVRRGASRPAQSGARRQLDSSTYQQLERDRSRRYDGAQRTRDYGNYTNRGGNADSYRPSGGARPGGGARPSGGARGGRGRG